MKKNRTFFVLVVTLGLIALSSFLLIGGFLVIGSIDTPSPWCYQQDLFTPCQGEYYDISRDNLWSDQTNTFTNFGKNDWVIETRAKPSAFNDGKTTNSHFIGNIRDYALNDGTELTLFLSKIELFAQVQNNNALFATSKWELRDTSGNVIGDTCQRQGDQNGPGNDECSVKYENIKIVIDETGKVEMYSNCENKQCNEGNIVKVTNFNPGERVTFNLFSSASRGANGLPVATSKISYNGGSWENCVADDWQPAPSGTCIEESFVQSNSCGFLQEVEGTKDCSSVVGEGDDITTSNEGTTTTTTSVMEPEEGLKNSQKVGLGLLGVSLLALFLLLLIFNR